MELQGFSKVVARVGRGTYTATVTRDALQKNCSARSPPMTSRAVSRLSDSPTLRIRLFSGHGDRSPLINEQGYYTARPQKVDLSTRSHRVRAVDAIARILIAIG